MDSLQNQIMPSYSYYQHLYVAKIYLYFDPFTISQE